MIAESVWSAPCTSEMIAGVQCDGVIHVRDDYLVLIEISVRDDLAKLRDDMTKLSTMKQALLGQGKYAETYFVTSKDDHPSLKTTAGVSGVEFHTLRTFASKFLGTSEYRYERERVPFGSAVKPQSGDSDTGPYTAIGYVDSKGKAFRISDVADALVQKKKIILLGEFGTGKSRCLKETFANLAKAEGASSFVPIAINLRDNWGYNRLDLMIRNHLNALGLSTYADNLVKSVRRGNHPLLLDGFDEIGSQSWSGDVALLAEVRRRSLEGVRDAMTSSGHAGVLITGREHYFSNDEEMLDGLGMKDDTIILRCPDEFSESEARDYITSHSPTLTMPDWMPRKPLICQLLVSLDPVELRGIEDNADGEVAFFEDIVDAVCRRETRISSSITADTVKGVLLHLAQQSRSQMEHTERLTMPMINTAFYAVTGYAPIDESAILLQRLPYLGRVGSESSDRSFIDPYARSGLRGIAMARMFASADQDGAKESWRQRLDDFGLRVWATRLAKDKSPLKYVRACQAQGNGQVAADYVAARLTTGDAAVDFDKLTVVDGSISTLMFTDSTVSNLTLLSVHIEHLVLDNSRLNSVMIDNCVIDRVTGASSRDKLPSTFTSTTKVGEFDPSLSSSRISQLKLSDEQKTLLAVIKKLFFQPGSGRREEALLRGTEGYWNKASADSVLAFMETNSIIRKVKGREGALYLPQRKHMKRMAKIMDDQRMSTDPLWEIVS